MEINIDDDVVKYNYNNNMSFFRAINEKCKSYIWNLIEEHMDMVYVDSMSDTEIRFANRNYVRYLTVFGDFNELVFEVFERDMYALSNICSQVHSRPKIANDDDFYQCEVFKNYYEARKKVLHVRGHTALAQGWLTKGRATFNSEKRMLKLISGLVNIVFELVFELQYYNNKDCQRPLYPYLKEYAKEEIIYGDFSHCSFAGKELIKYIRAIALVAHQCCMYKLYKCQLDAFYPSFCVVDIHNSFASAYEELNEVERPDKAIIDEMDKLVRIVSEYDRIDTVNYKQSFITYLIYNYKEPLFDIL